MKLKPLRFFSPQENIVKEEKIQEQPKATGYISSNGKLVFPVKAIESLGFNPEATAFRVGAQEGKRKLKQIYLVPAALDDADAFSFVKGGKSYAIALGIILQKGGVEYGSSKFTFTIEPFGYEEGVTGYELTLSDSGEKAEVVKLPYTGKKRGRKPRLENVNL